MMKILCLLIGSFFSTSTFINAQVGKVGINTTTPAAMLHVKDSSVVFTGLIPLPGSPGSPPLSGAGARMMWYPAKAAFRTGLVNSNQWDKNNIGGLSFAANEDTKAMGWGSSALGCLTIASNSYSIATGFLSEANGYASLSMGQATKANGNYSLSMGFNTTTNSYASLVLGRYNTIHSASSSTSWSVGDIAFVIGNGSSEAVRSNAFTILKNGRTGINTYDPNAMLHVKDSSVLFTGIDPLPVTPGNPPVSGAGTRMMWYPDKASFRAGRVSANQWNKDSIGYYSAAFGLDTKAKGFQSTAMGHASKATATNSTAMGFSTQANGNSSTAMGNSTQAIGHNSTAMGLFTQATGNTSTAMGYLTNANNQYTTAMGFETTASGQASIAMGTESTASGGNSTAMGNVTTASGTNSVALGQGTIASGHSSATMGYFTRASADFSTAFGFSTSATSYASMVIGQLNDTTSISGTGWNLLDPVFVIGIGVGSVRKNAMTILKNGNVGIGTISPQKLLHTSGGASGATPTSSAVAVFENNTAVSINLLSPNAQSSAVHFGNPTNAVHGGIVYNSPSANGLAFRTNGNVTRAVITDTGDMGIGDNTPDGRLHVSEGTGGNMYFTNAELIIEDDASSYIQFSNLDVSEAGILSGNQVTDIRGGLMFKQDSSVQIRTGGNNTRIIVANNGNTAIGNFTPTYRLHLNTDSAAKPTSNTWTVASDARLKKDVHNYEEGLNELLKIQPVWFTYNGEAGMPDETGVGVLAQELQQIAPYMVGTWNHKNENGNTTPYLNVNNGAMTYMLINAVKEQQEIINRQQVKIDFLVEKFNALEQQFNKQKQ